jgi:arylsulfatase A-like enzyme
VCDAFVSHAIDLATTFGEAAGAFVPETFQGTSLLPLLAGKESNGRQDILSMYHGNQFGLYSARMVRDRRYKYVWNASAEDELYDLALDPGELHNLSADGAYHEELERLRHRLVTWMEEIDDPLLNEWTRRQLLQGLSV